MAKTPVAAPAAPPTDTPFDPGLIAATEDRLRGAFGARAGAPAVLEGMAAGEVPPRGTAKARAAARMRGNPPKVVAGRLAKLGIRPTATLEGAARVDPAEVPADPREAYSDADIANGLERIIGRNELLGVQYLDAGLAAARTVGRVLVRGPSGNLIPMGTGFLISPRLLMTNNHVIGSAARAAGGVVEFNYQNGPDGDPRTPVRFELDPDACFVTSPAEELDYSVVAVKDAAAGDRLGDFGHKPLVAVEDEVLDGECVTIVQHPNGEPKQVALRENYVLRLPEGKAQFLHYQTDTTPGSSGSPVFNDEWDVVALHHSGLPERDGQGRILTPEGEVWKRSMGEHRIHWIANEGIRVAAIAADLRSRTDLGPAARGLLATALRPTPGPAGPESRRPAPAVEPRASTGPAVGTPPTPPAPVPSAAGGEAVTWTIPLQVTVSLGMPAARVAGTPLAPPAAAGRGDPAMAEALAELEAGASRPYYDGAADAEARAAYYAGVPADLAPGALFEALGELLRSTHVSQLAYKPSSHLYPWVDLRPDRAVQSIYSGLRFEPLELIRRDLEIDRLRAESLARFAASEAVTPARLEALEADLEAALAYNCEHVVPQSWFAKRQPMRGDLHHLFACEPDCNSFRGNIPYFDFADFGEAIRTDCGKREGNRFEPGGGKGAVARATLYFLLRYPGQVNASPDEYTADRVETLLAWHAADPPGEYEFHRNQAIFEKQGNRNPLIDHPDWAARIDFGLGLG